MKIKIINKSSNDLPKYETESSAGMDIRAYLENEIIIKPLERTLIPTGLYISLPKGHEAQIRPRSGLAIKRGITVLNSPGTIDADYRGEICVILINLSNEEYTVKNGDRIAQVIIAKHSNVVWEEVIELDLSSRGNKGFGSTGI
ncbi:MAG: dUTP diphosphatase [Bacteroidota bacterium]|nr:dUTP diphosphatase [Bacteroidota bacterium]